MIPTKDSTRRTRRILVGALSLWTIGGASAAAWFDHLRTAMVVLFFGSVILVLAILLLEGIEDV